jgi:hypothetical protein
MTTYGFTAVGCLVVWMGCTPKAGPTGGSGGGGSPGLGGWGGYSECIDCALGSDPYDPYEPEPGESCYDERYARILAPVALVGHQGLCTPTQLEEFFAICFASTAEECALYSDHPTNVACTECLGWKDEDIATHPVLALSWNWVWLNTPACEAVVQGKSECAQSAADLDLCRWSSCLECYDAAEVGACKAYAEQQICGTLPPVSADCQSTLPAPGMESPECAGEDFKSSFMKVASVICGPTP